MQDMKSFLAEFNKAPAAGVLAENKTPKPKYSSLKGGNIAGRRRQTSNELPNIAKQTSNFSHEPLSPSQSAWINGLERMRDRRKRLAKASKKGAITPKKVIIEQERMRLARRLSTLDFPLAACVDALREKDNNIRAAVDLLLEWHPKGSGGRAAVEKLLQVLLGAENKLQNMRNKLQVLYAPKVGSSGAAGPLSISAVREIFDRYDVDMSGSIDMDEFRKMMRDLGVRMTPEEFREAVGVSLTFHFFSFICTNFFFFFSFLLC